ncbi:sugar ABC transporter substrate-binding protein [Spongiactinospora sp. TRM90649]|uniref:sugar ABC transporter substrate-binding protein n=1 Tax=Spongiactinospora sp. TRM90649 TaxID=3031114 RepID=UPI0023F6BA31|nr:sugar ABC transporter substrate-binding protein [Spongiactinospora sp. TRM90649]MDF5753608.1 sugar ABC transporter substrate-binding protein [Spongiactinospora sp. TRM90649]
MTFTLAATAVLMAACGTGGNESAQTDNSSGGDKIAFLLPESKTARYEVADRPYFEKKLTELCPTCEIINGNAQGDAGKQQQQVEAAITKGVKVLVIDPVDVKAAASGVSQAKAAGIPVVSYARLVQGAPVDYFVSVDSFRGGQQQAEAMLTALKAAGKDKPRIVMINGSPTDSNAEPFKRGAHSVFDPAGVDVVREYDTPNWDPTEAQRQMEQAITSLGADGFDAVYVTNDGMASGVIAALRGADIDPGSRYVTGQDAEVAALQRIVAGEQFITLYQPIKKIADTSAQLAVNLLRGTAPTGLTTTDQDNGAGKVKSILLDTVVVTKDNIKESVLVDKFTTAEQICTGAYAAGCEKAGLTP